MPINMVIFKFIKNSTHQTGSIEKLHFLHDSFVDNSFVFSSNEDFWVQTSQVSFSCVVTLIN